MKLGILGTIYDARFFLKRKTLTLAESFLRSCESISWPRDSLHFKNPKVYCHIQKGPQMGPIQSQMNPVRFIYYIKIHTDNP
jgi:hypothetical protein